MELLRSSAPALVHLDINWDTVVSAPRGSSFGLEVLRGLAKNPKRDDALRVVVKTVDQGGQTAATIKQLRWAQPLRRAAIAPESRYNLQFLPVSRTADSGDDPDLESEVEREMVRYQLLLLHEIALREYCQNVTSYSAVEEAIAEFESELSFYGCFCERRDAGFELEYIGELRGAYGRLTGVQVQSRNFATISPDDWLVEKMELHGPPPSGDAVALRKWHRRETYMKNAKKCLRSPGTGEILGNEGEANRPKLCGDWSDGASGPIDLSYVDSVTGGIASSSLNAKRLRSTRKGEENSVYIDLRKAGADSLAWIRFLLRWPSMHQLETLLAALPGDERDLRQVGVSKNAVQQKMSEKDLRAAMNSSLVDTVEASELKEMVSTVIEAMAGDPISENEIKRIAGMPHSSEDEMSNGSKVYDELSEKMVWEILDLGKSEKMESLLRLAEDSCRQPWPGVRQEFLTRSLQALRRSCGADMLFVSCDLRTRETKGHASFSGKVFKLADRSQFAHPSAFSRRVLREDPTGSTSSLIEALARDPMNSNALAELAQLDDAEFEKCCLELSLRFLDAGVFSSIAERRGGTGKIDFEDYSAVFGVRVNLLSQVMTGLHLLRNRLRLFCATLALGMRTSLSKEKKKALLKNPFIADNDFKAARDSWSKSEDIMHSLPVLRELWLERQWDKLFLIEWQDEAGNEISSNEVRIIQKVVDTQRNRDPEFSMILSNLLKKGNIRRAAEHLGRKMITDEVIREIVEFIRAEVDDLKKDMIRIQDFDPLRGEWQEANLLDRLESWVRSRINNGDERIANLEKNILRFERFALPSDQVIRFSDYCSVIREIPAWFRLGWMPPANKYWMSEFDMERRPVTYKEGDGDGFDDSKNYENVIHGHKQKPKQSSNSDSR